MKMKRCKLGIYLKSHPSWEIIGLKFVLWVIRRVFLADLAWAPPSNQSVTDQGLLLAPSGQDRGGTGSIWAAGSYCTLLLRFLLKRHTSRHRELWAIQQGKPGLTRGCHRQREVLNRP
jgi:hypothetical protein